MGFVCVGVSVSVCCTIRGYIEPILCASVCALVGVCERDREDLSDFKREGIFQDAISPVCQSFQPCKKDNLGGRL